MSPPHGTGAGSCLSSSSSWDPNQVKVRVWHLSRFASAAAVTVPTVQPARHHSYYSLSRLLKKQVSKQAKRSQAIEEVNQGNIFSVKRENDCLMVITFSIS